MVGSLNEDLVVKCNTSKQQVTWTQNGELEPMAELVAKGQTLTILGLDLPATGNYSCWASGVLLDTTYVVVRVTGTWGRGKGGPAQPCGTAGRGWMQGVWGQVGDQETPVWHVVMREARATACKVGDALRGAAEPLGAQPWGQPAHAAWGRGTIPQPRLTLTIVPWPHQVRRRPRTSPARLTPTAAPSAAPGRGPARLFSVPG